MGVMLLFAQSPTAAASFNDVVVGTSFFVATVNNWFDFCGASAQATWQWCDTDTGAIHLVENEEKTLKFSLDLLEADSLRQRSIAIAIFTT